MPTELNLLEWQGFSTILFIVGSFIVLSVTGKSIQIQKLKDAGVQTSAIATDTTRPTYTASLIFLVGLTILAITATIRANEKESKSIDDSGEDPAATEKTIATGYWLAAIGYVLVSLGAYQNVQKAAVRITTL